MNKWIILSVIAAFAAGFFIGESLNKPKATDNEIELSKDILFHKFHIEKLQDTVHMKQLAINVLTKKVNYTDSLLKLRPKHEAIIISAYSNAPVSRLDSFRWARYPDSATVARRGDH